MTFSDEAPALTQAGTGGNCRGGARSSRSGAYLGTSVLFQRLLGFTKQLRDSANTTICNDHASKPYFTADDVNDWTWVTIMPKASAADRRRSIQPYDLPTLRAATSLTLSLPRVGFYTTPAFLALWNTNDSNQHRVTANQTLLVALGQAFTSREHRHAVHARRASTAATRSTAANARLPPDARPDAPVLGQPVRLQRSQRLPGAATATTPATRGPTGALVNEFAFGNVNATGSSINDLGGYLAQVTDGAGMPALRHRGRAAALLLRQLVAVQRERPGVPPHGRRVQETATSTTRCSSKEFFTSPLVTGAAATSTSRQARSRQHRAPRPPVRGAVESAGASPTCARRRVALPTQAQTATARIAASVAADAFSRGAESPVTPSEPTMFYRAATEMLCENIATQVVDATTGARLHQHRHRRRAINAMVDEGDGLPAQPPAARAGGADPDRHHQVAAAPRGDGSTASKRNRRPPVDVRAGLRVTHAPSVSDCKGGTS